MTRRPIDYGRLNDALLERVDSLLSQWLSNGVERNGRWYVGDFDGSAGESANVNMRTGQWIDNGSPGDQGGDLISLYARIEGLAGNHEAAIALMELLGWQDRREDANKAVQTPRPAGQAASSAQEPPPWDEPPAAVDASAQREPRKGKKQAKWQPIVPVPPYAPAPKFVFGFKNEQKGGQWEEHEAVCSWAYRFDDKLYGHVARFERVNSKGEVAKDTLPFTWCENVGDARGGQRWHAKQWDNPRPLYVPAGSLVPQLPVLLVEGEKCADAAHALVGTEFSVVSWPGGCKAWQLANWSWLDGLTVYLWPDLDQARERLTKAEKDAGIDPATKPALPPLKQPGMLAMQGIGTELQAKHKCKVYLCRVLGLGVKPAGWDVADAIAEGWDADKLRDFVRGAAEFTSTNDEARAMVGAVAAGAESLAGASEEERNTAWRRALITTQSGVKACRENAVLAMDGMRLESGAWLPGAVELEGVIGFDEFSNNVTKLKAPPWGGPAGLWQEEDELELGCYLTRSLYLPPLPRGTLEEAVLMVAKRHKFHPVRQQIEGLRGKWDKEPRAATWLKRVCMKGQETDPDLDRYLALAGTWFLMAMCARVLTPELQGAEIRVGPGCKFDYMLILEGPQGFGKSTIAKVLGGGFYADTGLILGEKDSYQNIQGIAIYEWGELDSMSKADVKLVKLFIASDKDRFRATFDRRPRDYPRQVVFVGTTNEDHYLTDGTGNRRFWPVRLMAPADLAWLRENREQLLAEALHYLDAKVRFHPTIAEQRKLFDPQQSSRMVESSIDALIRDYLYNEKQHVPLNGIKGSSRQRITMPQLLMSIGYSHDKQTDVVVRKAGQTMSRLGWQIAREKADETGHRPRVYVRPAKAAPAPATAPGGAAGPASASPVLNGPAQGTETEEASYGCPV